MTESSLHSAERLFAQALERPADERRAWLAAQAEAGLAGSVEALQLLDDEARAGELFENLVADELRSWAAGENEQGRLLGPYRLLREIGRGGMSVVYLAERDDDANRQRVAVKLIRRGMDTAEIRARFRHERRILANLNHPNIAKVLDGGASPEGLPYIVMEYIEGRPVDRYCDEEGLSLGERARLFVTICEAVDYAHRQLVIHRDLKPGNVLVDGDGAPKLLDFGIAKLLDPAFDDPDAPVTGQGLRPMTPAYASPEQAFGRPLTTAADVYSLGALLYRLLTGRRPSTGREGAPQAWLGPNRLGEPAKPSKAVLASPASDPPPSDGLSSEQRARRLRGDLDSIALKAMRREPEQRYHSAVDLAADLGRWLAKRPVAARRGAAMYRAGKFIERRWLAVVAASATILAIAAALVVMYQQTRRAERTLELLFSVFEKVDPMVREGETITSKELLDHGFQKVSELADQPDVAARFLNELGIRYEKLGLYADAERAYRKSLATLIDSGSDQAEIADAHNRLGRTLAEQGAYGDAEQAFQAALDINTRVFGPVHERVAANLNNLALAYHDQGRLVEAEAAYRRTLALDQRLNGDDHALTVITKNNLTLLLYDEGKYDEAESLARDALAWQRGQTEPFTISQAVSLRQMGMILQAKGHYDEAEALFQEALAIHLRMSGPDHPLTARQQSSLAAVWRDQGHFEEAAALFRDALAAQRRFLGKGHIEVALTMQERGWLLLDQGRPAEAEAVLEASLWLLDDALPSGSALKGPALLGLGVSLARQRACRCAQEFLARGLALTPNAHPRAPAARQARMLCGPEKKDAERPANAP